MRYNVTMVQQACSNQCCCGAATYITSSSTRFIVAGLGLQFQQHRDSCTAANGCSLRFAGYCGYIIAWLPPLCIRADIRPHMLSAAACCTTSSNPCCRCAAAAAHGSAILAADLQAGHIGHAAGQAAGSLQAAAAGAANAVLAVPARHQTAPSGRHADARNALNTLSGSWSLSLGAESEPFSCHLCWWLEHEAHSWRWRKVVRVKPASIAPECKPGPLANSRLSLGQLFMYACSR